MKALIFTISVLCSLPTFAWTLVGQGVSGFNVDKVTVNVASTSCANAGFDTTTLKNHITEAIDTYWNKVATASIELETGTVTTIDIDGQTTAGSVAQNLASDNTILVGCNDDVSSFSGGSTGGVGSISCSSSGVCRGGVILNAHANSNLDTYSNQELFALIAHEIGHALGLGHSSVEEALMYFSLSGKSQEFLAQDDINGITYLYPNEDKLGGLAGSCATINTDDGDGPGSGPLAFALTITLGFLLVSLSNRRFTLKPVRYE